MTKYIRIRFPNDELFDVPAEIIAKNRANYYAETDTETTYDEEFDFAMGDNHELVDWLYNNMNWEDVETFAVRVEQKNYDYGKNFSDSESEIIEY